MLAELKKPQNLNQPDIVFQTDREKAPFFKTKEEQQEHWNKILVSQLISFLFLLSTHGASISSVLNLCKI